MLSTRNASNRGSESTASMPVSLAALNRQWEFQVHFRCSSCSPAAAELKAAAAAFVVGSPAGCNCSLAPPAGRQLATWDVRD